MLLMLLPVLCISFSQFPVPYHKQIFSIVLLSSFGEIERPCDNGLSANDHDLVVCDSVFILQMPISFFRLLC